MVNIIRCTHCGSYNFRKNGKYKNSQRFICKDCNRAFSDRVKKFTYKDKEKFLQYYMNNVGIRKSALFMGCSPSLIVRWIRELSDNIRRNLNKAKSTINEYNNKDNNNKDNNENKIPDIIEMDEIYTRVKKGQIKSQFGLLILDDKIELLHIPLEKE